jgi:hypothetical protein
MAHQFQIRFYMVDEHEAIYYRGEREAIYQFEIRFYTRQDEQPVRLAGG